MRRFLLILLAFTSLGVLAPIAQATDPYEPNDSALEATPVHGSTDYNASLDTIVDEDWYVFYSPGKQQVVLTMANLVGEWPSQLIEVIGPESGTGSGPWGVYKLSPLTVYLPVVKGRYYVRVWPGGSTDPKVLGIYRLRLVPSDHFVTQACLEETGQLRAAKGAVSHAQAAVGKDHAAIRRDEAGMRHEAKTGKGPKWRAWHRKLEADQGKLAADRKRLAAAQAKLAKLQAATAKNCKPF